MRLTPETPVGAVVVDRLGRARVFERLGIDYCCHGTTPLAEACGTRSLDVERVLAELAESDVRDQVGEDDRVDWGAVSESKLVDHIVETHHAYLRRELPRLAVLIDKVAVAHSAGHPELDDLRATFVGLRQELESHMIKEERILFPLIKQLDAAQALFPIHCGTVGNPIRVMEHEHAEVASALERLRRLTGDYEPPGDGCDSFRVLYEGLAQLDADLRRHIHKENNILFPKAAAIESALRNVKP